LSPSRNAFTGDTSRHPLEACPGVRPGSPGPGVRRTDFLQASLLYPKEAVDRKLPPRASAFSQKIRAGGPDSLVSLMEALAAPAG